jgi:NADPH2 dehydrogenase
VDDTDDADASGPLNPFLGIWVSTSPISLAGGFNASNAAEAGQVTKLRSVDAAIMFGRFFTSNSDLAYRIKKGIGLTRYNRDDFYRVKSPVGYVDECLALLKRTTDE